MGHSLRPQGTGDVDIATLHVGQGGIRAVASGLIVVIGADVVGIMANVMTLAAVKASGCISAGWGGQAT
jgi:hypothetical protein